MLNTQGTSTTSVPGVPAAVMNLSATWLETAVVDSMPTSMMAQESLAPATIVGPLAAVFAVVWVAPAENFMTSGLLVCGR